MKKIEMTCAPSRSCQPPIVMIAVSAALASRSRIVPAFVAFDPPFSRLGWWITRSSAGASAIASRSIREREAARDGQRAVADGGGGRSACGGGRRRATVSAVADAGGRRSARATAVLEAQQRPLQQHVAERGDRDRGGGRGERERHEPVEPFAGEL